MSSSDESTNHQSSKRESNTNDIQSALQSTSTSNTSFRSFQTKFAVTFLCALLADWLTGAYLYQLYQAYNFPKQWIAYLYIIGFASSAFVSSFIGSIADKFGRKKMCLFFCITYAICALVKHSSDFKILLFARFLGGLSTSILFSCFESWMISEHHHLGFSSNLLGGTFQLVWGLNSIVAIISGPLSGGAYNIYKYFNIAERHEIGAFDLSAFFLGVTFILILVLFKNENYGNSEVNMFQSLQNTRNVLFGGRSYNVVILGLMSACFEGAMYTFVFAWWNILNEAKTQANGSGIDGFTDKIFTVFMIGCLLGTLLNGLLRNVKCQKIAVVFCSVAGLVFLAQRLIWKRSGSEWWKYEMYLGAFVVFEVCVGMYWPIIGGLRERYIPDEVRATVMNLFRIPLNFIACVGIGFGEILDANVFILLGGLLLVAAGCALWLYCDDEKESNDDSMKETNT